MKKILKILLLTFVLLSVFLLSFACTKIEDDKNPAEEGGANKQSEQPADDKEEDESADDNKDYIGGLSLPDIDI